MSSKKAVIGIKQDIANGYIEEAIRKLINLNFSNKEGQKQVMVIASRYKELQQANILHTISFEESNIEQNKIKKAILDIIDNEDYKFNNLPDLKTIALFLFPAIFIALLYMGYNDFQKKSNVKLAVSEFREFKENKDNEIAMALLDYSPKVVDLYPEDGIDSLLIIRNDLLQEALRLHRDKQSFTRVETRIRSIFDSFFENMGFFNKYMDTGLLNKNDVEELKYWIDIMVGPDSDRKPQALKETIKAYVDYYDFTEFKELCSKFGYDLD